MRHIFLFQISQFLFRQSQIHRSCRPFHMVKFGRSHHRRSHLGEQPGQRDFRHAHPMPVSQFGHTPDDAFILFSRSVIFKTRIVILFQTFRGLSRPFGQAASSQRAVRRHGDVVLCAQLCHLPFLFPENQIIVSLHRYEGRKALPLCQSVCLGQLPGKAVGNPDISGLSRLHYAVQPFHDIVKRRRIIPHMIDIEIHILHAQIFQAGINHPLYMLLPGHALFHLLGRTRQELGGHHHLIPLRIILQRASHILFACSALVSDCRIEEIDAEFQPMPDDLAGLFLIQRPGMLAICRISKSHTSHADAGHIQIRIP